jgi:hypothetical protein
MGPDVVARQGILAGEQPQPSGAALFADGARMSDQVAIDEETGDLKDGVSGETVTTDVVMTSAAVSMGQLLRGGNAAQCPATVIAPAACAVFCPEASNCLR